MKKMVFVLPTKNEENSISRILLDIKNWCQSMELNHHLIVVDDSNDKTALRAEELGAQVVSGQGVGLGYAMFLGLNEALKANPDVIVSLDSDGQVDAQELKRFMDEFRKGEFDLLISSRFKGDDLIKYRYPTVNYLGNRILVLILRLSTGLRLTDSHGGIRMMKPDVVKKHWQIGRHTYVQETLIVARRNGFKLLELPSVWLERGHGDSRVLKSIFRYVYRTSPALAYHLKIHWLLMALSLYGFWKAVQFESAYVFALSGLCMLGALFVLTLPFKALRYAENS